MITNILLLPFVPFVTPCYPLLSLLPLLTLVTVVTLSYPFSLLFPFFTSWSSLLPPFPLCYPLILFVYPSYPFVTPCSLLFHSYFSFSELPWVVVVETANPST